MQTPKKRPSDSVLGASYKRPTTPTPGGCKSTNDNKSEDTKVTELEASFGMAVNSMVSQPVLEADAATAETSLLALIETSERIAREDRIRRIRNNPVARVPHEILEIIFHQISDQRTLHSLSLVCRSFNICATPLLYATPRFAGTFSWAQFGVTILRRKENSRDLASFVQVVDLSCAEPKAAVNDPQPAHASASTTSTRASRVVPVMTSAHTVTLRLQTIPNSCSLLDSAASSSADTPAAQAAAATANLGPTVTTAPHWPAGMMTTHAAGPPHMMAATATAGMGAWHSLPHPPNSHFLFHTITGNANHQTVHGAGLFTRIWGNQRGNSHTTTVEKATKPPRFQLFTSALSTLAHCTNLRHVSLAHTTLEMDTYIVETGEYTSSHPDSFPRHQSSNSTSKSRTPTSSTASVASSRSSSPATLSSSFLTLVPLTIDSAIVKTLSNCPHLLSLDFAGCEWVSKHNVELILDGAPNLRHLNLTGCPKVPVPGAKMWFVPPDPADTTESTHVLRDRILPLLS
ncbi:hypothetical protein DFJ77DRAFT_449084 [Powellomyces hirtus]|nr:hypothetical protein DFJ77DRAFT_449084 [Powellomyces hirtus]